MHSDKLLTQSETRLPGEKFAATLFKRLLILFIASEESIGGQNDQRIANNDAT